MKASELSISQLLVSGNQYVIPVFQRYYTWGKDDWEQLWEDIATLLEPGQEGKHHFLGSIVCLSGRNQMGAVSSFQVIDGQQRIMTLSILLCVLRDVAKEFGHEDLAAEINESFLINKFKKGSEHYKVFPRLRDRLIFQAMIDTNSATLQQSQVRSAYVYFRGALDKTGADNEAPLRTMLRTITERLDLVAITLEGESPYKIFKSLNSTGVELGEQDLIRNHVFMSLPLQDQDQFDEDHWRPIEQNFITQEGKLDGKAMAGFFRDSLMRDGTYVKADAVADEFERVYPVGAINPYQVVSQSKSVLRLYKIIQGKEKHGDPGVTKALANLRALDVTTATPLVLSLLELNEASELSLPEVKQGITAITSFVLRRSISGGKTRQYGPWFCSACKELRSPKGLDGLIASLHQRGWPDDESFKEMFLRYDLYHSEYGRIVLESIEHSIQNPNEPVLLEGCTVEHVMPQTINDDSDGIAWQAALGPEWQVVHQKWQHTPGNLTLVGADYNRSMSNRPFDLKKKTLSDSYVYLNRYFKSPALTIWNETEIVHRGETLAEIAVQLWPRL